MARLIFRISKDGTRTTVVGEGFHGQQCVEKARPFFAKLGEVESMQLKDEYYEVPFVDNEQKVVEEF